VPACPPEAAAGAPVLVVEDDTLLRAQIVEHFNRVGHQTREADNGGEALELADRQHLSLVVLDIALPGLSGYQVCSELKAKLPTLPIILISGERTEPMDRTAGLLIGADDYLTKPFAPEELLARALSVRRRSQPAIRTDRYRLTAREHEILGLLATGLSEPEIADRLIISAKTAASHIEHLRAKLGARSRAQAIAIAYRDGLVQAEESRAKRVAGL
jgi:DNA-binding NarL/FixJ family response regulator